VAEPQESGCPELRDGLVAILGGLEALADMLRGFIDAHQAEPHAAELMPALFKAKDASEGAAAVVRSRLRATR